MEEKNLDKKSPEFRALLSEIRDGVLLSQLMEENVWARSMADSTGQRQYFEQHKDKYRFPERALATIIVAQTEGQLKQTTDVLSGKPPYQLRRAGPVLTYDRNQTTVVPDQRESLVSVLAVLLRNPEYVVEVSGSHDPAERDSVSAGRIRSVVSYLQQKGVSLSRIAEKDYQGARPSEPSAPVPPVPRRDISDPAAQRTVTFQYFSNAKADVVNVLNTQFQPVAGATTSAPAVTITDGLFAQGMNPYLDAIGQWQPGTTILRPAGKVVAVTIVRIEPARPKTFAEARGAVINDYQAVLEKQWLARLRQKYPVNVNADEMKKLVK